jgi:hypothetical protein
VSLHELAVEGNIAAAKMAGEKIVAEAAFPRLIAVVVDSDVDSGPAEA